MEHQSGKLRTRSQAAPDWTAQDSLILVNEISAVENDCLNTLSSFQKWKIIVQNCNALEVHRNLNQCKRKWDSLLSQYRKIKKQEVHVGFPENFNGDLFRAIDDYVRVKEGRSDTESDCDPGDDDDDVPDSDPCEEDDEEMDTDLLIDVFADSVSPVSKMKKRKLMPHNEGAKESDPLAKSIKSEKVECQRQCGDAKMMAEESSPVDKVQMTISLLQNNAAQMKAILNGELGKGMDYKMGDAKDSSATQTDITRRKGDELITCLGDSAFALDQLCQLLQKK